MEQAVHFTEEKNFDREGYDTCLRRLNYDDRDVVMYENMLAFLWEYAVRPGCLADYRGLLSEYSRWNMQMIRKCYYHLPHDLPYANIRRAYESVIHLLDGKIEEGLLQLEAIGTENFHYDGRAPKLLMTKNGKRFVPVSKLYLLYNYYKVLKRLDEEQAVRFHGEMWLFVHGIATALATGYLPWDEEQVSRMMSDVYFGLRHRFCQPEQP